MGTGYVRNDSANNIADGNVINASDLDGEFDAIAATLATSGHTHDGTAAEGGPITVLGPVQDFVATASVIRPKTDNTLDIGTASLEFKDLFIDGKAYIDGFGEDTLFDTNKKIQFRDAGLYINSSGDGILDLVSDTELQVTAPTVDINASTAVLISNDLKLDSDAAVLGFGVDNDVTLTHVADTGLLLNSTMALQFNDASQFINAPSATVLDVTATDEIELNATLVDVNGNLDVSGTALITGVATFTATPVFNADLVIEDDLVLDSDGAILMFGEDNEVTLTHVHNTGLLLNSTMALQFNDASQFINAPSATVLDITATDEIELNATAIDLNGTLDVSGTALVTGVLTTTAAPVFNGGFAANDGSTITTADNSVQLELISTDEDASKGSVLSLYRNSTSPADNDDVGNIVFNAENDAGQKVIYADILCELGDVTDGTEDASLALRTITAGSLQRRLQIKDTELVINEGGKDSDFRVESDAETHAIFVQGSDGFVGINNSSPATALDVTGTVSVAGDLDVSSANSRIRLYETDTTDLNTQLQNQAGDFNIARLDDDAGGSTVQFSIDHATGNVRIGDSVAAATITGLTQTNLVVGSATGGEIVTYRNDNGIEGDDFVGAFLFGNDDNNGTEDHFAGMWALSSSTNGNMDIHWAAGLGNYEAGTPQMTLNNAGSVGIGTSSIDGTLHVHTASAGTVTASAQADDLVIENSTEGGMTIITPDAQSARIRFTSPSTNTDVGGAFIFYRQNINKMQIGTSVAGGVLSLVSGAANEAMVLDASGAVTKPLQPAFLVRPTSTQNNVAENEVVVFGTEVFDQGADFSSNTFTAPVTGRYQLNAVIRVGEVDSAASWNRLEVITSNRSYNSAIIDPGVLASDPVYWHFQTSVLADMDAGDTAQLKLGQNGGTTQIEIFTDSHFSGFLAC